jgi:hypothetical protein
MKVTMHFILIGDHIRTLALQIIFSHIPELTMLKTRIIKGGAFLASAVLPSDID